MKKALLLFIFASYCNLSEGQTLTDSLKNSARNQFDIGLNFSYYFDKAPLKMDAITEAGRGPLNIISSLHFGYKRFISNRVCILISRQQFHPGFGFFKPDRNSDFYSRGDLGWRAGYINYGIGGGWALKKGSFQSVFSLQFIYGENEFGGLRMIFWEYTDERRPIFEQHIAQFLQYEDKYGFGISPGIDLNYFFCKRLGIGFNSFLNYFPFAKSSFDRADFYIVDYPTPSEIAKYNKPDKVFFSANLKLVYCFSDPKFIRHSHCP